MVVVWRIDDISGRSRVFLLVGTARRRIHFLFDGLWFWRLSLAFGLLVLFWV
jgi:hypothetical protein